MGIKINHEYVLRYGGNVKPQRVMHVSPSEPFSNRHGYCTFINYALAPQTIKIIMHHIQQGNFKVNDDKIEVINPSVPACYIEAYSEQETPEEFNRLCRIIAGGVN